MKLKILLLVGISIFSILSGAFADHDCIEAIPAGNKINLKNKFPDTWLSIGGKLITDPKLHSELSSKFKAYYSTGEDEGYTAHNFCAINDGIYIKVHMGKSDIETQCHARFSAISQKCNNCKRLSKNTEYLTLKIGLRIGQSKENVAKLLGVSIKEDINTISFEETLNDGKVIIKHTQDLRLVFQNDKLTDFMISDFKEQGN